MLIPIMIWMVFVPPSTFHSENWAKSVNEMGRGLGACISSLLTPFLCKPTVDRLKEAQLIDAIFK